MVQNEQAVIGCALIDSKCLYNVYDNLRPDMFVDEVTKRVYSEILAIYDSGKKVEVVELARRLESFQGENLNLVGYLKECYGMVFNSRDISSHARIISDEYKSRQVKALIDKTNLLPNQINDTIADLITRLEELETNQKVQSKSLAELVEENKGNYFLDIELTKVYTGFLKIDECLGGLEGGEVMVVGARPAVGKSAFVTQIITNMAMKGIKVGYFNLEMSYKQVYERILARLSGIGLTRIKKAKAFLGDEQKKFESANEQMKMSNLIVSSGSKKISDIKAESRHQQFDVIVIDYLQLVRPDRTFNNRASEVGEISKSLKALAMELQIPIIALSQMNRENDEQHEPNISDLRESGDIEQDASIIALMWNITDTTKGFKIGKNRQGELMKIGLEFNGDNMTFTEQEKIEPQKKKEIPNLPEKLPWD